MKVAEKKEKSSWKYLNKFLSISPRLAISLVACAFQGFGVKFEMNLSEILHGSTIRKDEAKSRPWEAKCKKEKNEKLKLDNLDSNKKYLGPNQDNTNSVTKHYQHDPGQ